MANNDLNRFLGDTPARTIVKLVVISLVVGIILAALNLTPFELFSQLQNALSWAINRGMQLFGDFGRYLLYGAMVVVPVFLVTRLLSYRR